MSFLGVLGILLLSESGIIPVEPRDGDSVFLERRLGEDDLGESLGLSSDGGNGTSDSDPESKLFESPSFSSMKVTRDVIILAQLSDTLLYLKIEMG
jgi:hypothetical protein